MSTKSVSFYFDNVVFPEAEEKKFSLEKRKTTANLCLENINLAHVNENLIKKCNKIINKHSSYKITSDDRAFLREVSFRTNITPHINILSVDALASLVKENQELVKNKIKLRNIIGKLKENHFEVRKKINVNSNPYAYSDDESSN
jgi:hypothetical protein